MTLRKLIDQAGGRKFTLTAYTTIAATALLVGEYITEGAWQMVVLAALGIYGTANVSQRVGEARVKRTAQGDAGQAQAAP